MTARLNRGRTYARKGQVMDMKVQAGIVTAKVQGTRARPYSVSIRLKPLSDEEWSKTFNLMSQKAFFMAKLLAGEMPQEIEEAFSENKTPLFPTSSHNLETDCTCPDWANPCKHIAAVCYILAEAFDKDPFLMFVLRGRTKEQVVEELKKLRAPAAQMCGPDRSIQEQTAPLPIAPESYWRAGDRMNEFKVRMYPPPVPASFIKGLGPPPLSLGKENLADIFSALYTIISASAYRAVFSKTDKGSKDG